MGLFTLLLPSPLSLPFAIVGQWCAKMQNGVVLWASEHNFTGVEYEMPLGIVAVYYLVLGAITLVIWSLNRKRVVAFHELGIDDL